MKSVVLTGVSGGMGLITAKKLTEQGYHVFGLDIGDIGASFDGLTFIKTDVRNIKDVEHAFKRISKETNEVDAIISMAGTYNMNSLIEISEEDFIKIFDINVFGMYRVNKTFAPLLKDKGKVIMISSELAPLDPLPFTGLYGITKSTVEKYAYSLRMELQLLNKQVVLVRPGAVDTSFITKSNICIERFTNETKLYSYNAKRFMEIISGVEGKNIPTVKIAEKICKILRKKRPKYVYKINRNFGLLLLNALPKRLQNYIIKKILTKK